MKKACVCASLLAGVAAYALDPRSGGMSGSQAEPIRGRLLASSDHGGKWRTVEPGSVDQGDWLKTQDGSEAVVTLRNDAHLRLAENTTIHIEQASPENARVRVIQGKILASLPDHGRSQLDIQTPQGGVGSSGGSTMVDVNEGNTRVESIEGSATFQSDSIVSSEGKVFNGAMKGRVMPGIPVTMGEVAWDGPDVRKRPRRPKRFTQGEENRGRNLGEDVTPSPSPAPAVTPPEETVIIRPAPPPRPTQPPPTVVEGGGGEIWPYLVGAAGLGTGLYFLLRDTDEDNNNFVGGGGFIPASP
ncbi:MAG: FecR domain-containing protein [Vulcanimicrobiota bacterium]